PGDPDTRRYSVLIRLGDPSPIEPARHYRKWLIDQNQFVPMAEKIQRTPKVERLLGAAHVYLWGDDLLTRYDVRDWKRFCGKLKSHPIWQKMSEPAQKAATEIVTGEWAADHLKNEVAAELSRLLATPELADREAFAAAFPNDILPPARWGDGVSLTMLDQLKEAGLDRLCITTGDLSSAARRPDVVRHADELGYVLGPYDSYHSIHAPGASDTWETAQFDQALYDSGAILKRDGTPRHGFQKKGFMLSPLAAEPYVRKRVSALMGQAPFTSWFLDCDAFGEVFDDYSPLHPSTQAEDAAARAKRLAWISQTYNVPVGSEGGSVYATGAMHFAHGVMTPVIGWGDPALKEKTSPYFLGAYWPPDGPQVFTKQVPLKPEYRKLYYDPRYRLPLHQTVFHDSVIATHHWSAASLKFADQVQTTALLELLYSVPPMYHLNRAEFKKHRERITAQYAFFSTLHRELALLPMTHFQWLTDDRQVQRTVFGDKVEMVANFGEKPFDHAGTQVPPRSIMSRRLAGGGEPQVFSPAP
ncbi:MAG: glycoside hydrolase, partial [Tepidisphaeraceae bacterium]